MANGVFWFFFAVAVLSAAMCILGRNPISAAMWLVGTMFSLAAIFVLLDAPFLGAIQVLVYAGAIMVLFLFVIMFLNPGALERPRPPVLAFAVLLAALLAGVLAAMLIGSGPTDDTAAVPALFGSPQMLARSLFGEFVLPFEIASVLLLVAIVGAVVLGKREP